MRRCSGVGEDEAEAAGEGEEVAGSSSTVEGAEEEATISSSEGEEEVGVGGAVAEATTTRSKEGASSPRGAEEGEDVEGSRTSSNTTNSSSSSNSSLIADEEEGATTNREVGVEEGSTSPREGRASRGLGGVASEAATTSHGAVGVTTSRPPHLSDNRSEEGASAAVSSCSRRKTASSRLRGLSRTRKHGRSARALEGAGLPRRWRPRPWM